MIDSRPGDTFQIGDLLNNTYRVEAILGRGGTSDVYRARSEISGRQVAVKVLKSEFSGNDDYLVLLNREEEIRDIRHDAVVRYSENHRTPEGHVYLLMDYINGPGLDAKLKQGPMPVADLLTVCRRVAEGLHAAHSRNIVHRDLSPDNIILRDGDPAQAVIIDFGIAKDTNPGAETIVGNEFAGKYAYAAPEQLAGRTDARTDIYSLGALLLANFRGRAPDIGRNPMEVVEKKAQPLDTSDVPEPLKALIDQMCAPRPEDRFQSASAVIAALDALASPADTGAEGGADWGEATVVVPRGAQPQTVPPRTVPPSRQTVPPQPQSAKTVPPQTVPPTAAADTAAAPELITPTRPAAPPPAPAKSRAGVYAAGLAAVLVLGGAGAWMGGLFDSLTGPRYPVADPFALVIEKTEGRAPRATGNVPSPEVQASLMDKMAGIQGAADLTLASGAIPEHWGQDMLGLVDIVAPLDTFRVAANGTTVNVTGQTSDAALQEKVNAALAALPEGLTGTADIRYQPVFLAAATLEPLLSDHADCGPLHLVAPPPTGYGPDSTVTVAGTLSSAEARAGLFDALRAAAGARSVVIDADILNPTLCLIENYLPKAPAGGMQIAFANGDADNAPNAEGRFLVGQNPVIDITLPATMTDGYLSVSALDVSGNVFHLLPNLMRPDNAVASLRAGQSGAVAIRVAYPVSEAPNGKIAFTVDDSTLGKTKIIALHSTAPLFADMRPTTESATGYAEALRDRDRATDAGIDALDSRILITAKE